MKTVAVIGANGFVGSHVVKALEKRGLTVIPVVRGDDPEEKIKNADAVIHAANSPSRFKAAKDPKLDFNESVEKTFKFLSLAKKYQASFVLVSSISARAQLEHPYGANRRSCECMALLEGAKVVRLGYMYSHSKTYGALDDIIHGRQVFLAADSVYSFSDVVWNAEMIVATLLKDKTAELVELGSAGSISLKEIATLLGSKSEFVGEYKDIQVAQDIPSGAPAITEFTQYLEKLK